MCVCVAVPTDDGRNSYVFNGARTTKSTRHNIFLPRTYLSPQGTTEPVTTGYPHTYYILVLLAFFCRLAKKERQRAMR